MVVEAEDARAQPWTKPDDFMLTLTPAKDCPAAARRVPSLFGDGSVRFLRDDLMPGR